MHVYGMYSNTNNKRLKQTIEKNNNHQTVLLSSPTERNADKLLKTLVL